MTEKEYLNAIGTYAVNVYSTKKILPSLPMAQAILETGHFKSSLFTKAYNLSGMKYKAGCGTDKIRMQTSEYYSKAITVTKIASTYGMTVDEVCKLNNCKSSASLSGYVKVYDYFRKYPTLDKGLAGFYKFYDYDRYKNLKGVTDYTKVYKLIQQDGWATSPTYTTMLTSVYKSNKTIMEKYDKLVKCKVGTLTENAVLRNKMEIDKTTKMYTIKKNSKVRIIKEYDKWVEVWYDGSTGYIVKKKVKF